MHDRVAELLHQAAPCSLPVERASTPPPAIYSDDDWFEAERRAVFNAGWVAVGRSLDVSAPNTYFAADVAGEPVIVVRGRDGELRALRNACAHRSTTIVEGKGSAASLQCPYHLWTYRLDGQLVAAPSMEQAEDFDAGEICLPRYAVSEWQGFVFVNIDRTAAPLAESMPTLDAHFSEHRIADLVPVGSFDCPSPWNWKITLENFLESYHHRAVHPQTLEVRYPGHKSWALYESDEPWSGLDHISIVEDSDPFLVFVGYPSLLVAVQRNEGMFWFRTNPASADHTDLTIELHLRPELADDSELVEQMLAAVEFVNDEDTPINRRTAEGLRAANAAPGRISHLEASTWHFRRWLLGRIQGSPGGPAAR